MDVDEALRQPGQLVAAWDDGSDDSWLGIYVAGDSGVVLLAFERNAGAARRADLAARTSPSVRPAAANSSGRLSASSSYAGTWAAGSPSPASDIAAGGQRVADVVQVTSFVQAGDLGHRGVSAPAAASRRRGARSHARDGPTYDRTNLLIDGLWAVLLGRALAEWLGVPHDDRI